MHHFKEIFKDVPNYEGLYQVSNLGNVKSLDRYVKQKDKRGVLITANYKGRILKKDLVRNGYYRVTLSRGDKQKRFQVHRLVCFAFLENPLNKPCVNHKDGNGMNNELTNLEWCTYSENERHSIDVLGKINGNKKLTDSQVEDIRLNAKKRVNISSYMDKYKVTRNVVLNVLNNKYYV